MLIEDWQLPFNQLGLRVVCYCTLHTVNVDSGSLCDESSLVCCAQHPHARVTPTAASAPAVVWPSIVYYPPLRRALERNEGFATLVALPRCAAPRREHARARGRAHDEF